MYLVTVLQCAINVYSQLAGRKARERTVLWFKGLQLLQSYFTVQRL